MGVFPDQDRQADPLVDGWKSEGVWKMDHDRPISPWQEWKITEKIGEGSYGKVYKAERTEQGHSFYSAIKVIPIPSNRSELNSAKAEIGGEDALRSYFKNIVDECIQEICTMEYFRGNSHIVSVEDFKVVEYLDEIGWDIYIRMEYLDSFLEYSAGREMMERDVIKLGIDLCKALEYCGQLRIIHRDVKPENIFVSRFGDFKLGDFGIARELEKSMGSMSKKGTFSYMAPEMYKGESYDSGVDLYALGIVLYKLMNRNRLPFMSLDKQLITYHDKELAFGRRMTGEEELPPPADASKELTRIILKACAFDPKMRYQDPELLRVDLEKLRRGEYQEGWDVSASQDHWTAEEPVEKPVEKPSFPLWILALAVGILAVFSVVFLLLFSDGSHPGEEPEPVPDYAEHNTDHAVEALQNNERTSPQIDDFSTALQTIREQASYIVEELPDCEEVGKEGEELRYYERENKLVKALIYPAASGTGMYEEYYYWGDALFFAFLWEESGQEELYYFNDKGEMIRWIDTDQVNHDMEFENEEYLEKEKYLWDISKEQLEKEPYGI